MDPKLFFECRLFSEAVDVFSGNFVVHQKEIVLDQVMGDQATFKLVDVKYSCHLIQPTTGVDKAKPLIIIPSRNQMDLIEYTLDNLFSNNIQDICSIMVVDDRSTDDYSRLLRRPGLCLLRVDNQKGFNFSMLCNIGAYVANASGADEIILWNNDVWADKREYLETIIKKHREDRATISGTKLLYPRRSFSNDTLEGENGKQRFPDIKDGGWRGTVQFGGSSWVRTNGPILFSPAHKRRFDDAQHYLVNDDHAELFVTGAFQLINLRWLMQNGGMNPSLSKNFQDVDLCLRASVQNKRVMYYGKDVFLWHDESFTFRTGNEKKNDEQFISDHVVFGVLWNDKIEKIIM